MSLLNLLGVCYVQVYSKERKNTVSYFPLLIQYQDQESPTVVYSPSEIESGRAFTVLLTNYKSISD